MADGWKSFCWIGPVAGSILVAAAAVAGQASAAEPDGLRVEAVADGVWAVLQPEAGRFDDSNAAVIVTARGVIVVDSQATPEATRAVLAEVTRLTDRPVRYLVNTHWHGDHTQGNQVYLEAFPGVEIVAFHTVAEDMEKRGEPQLAEEVERWSGAVAAAEQRLAAGLDAEGQPMSDAERAELPAKIDRAKERVAELRSIVPTPPTLDVDGRLVIDGGDRRVVLLPFRAHTRGDLVVHLPDDGVLVTGDLLDDLPFGGHGYPTSWVETLDSLAALGAEVVIPGHGPAFRGGEQLTLVRDLLRAAIAAAGEGAAKAGAEAELERVRQSMVGDDPLAAQAWEAFVPELLERAAAEARGTLDDAN